MLEITNMNSYYGNSHILHNISLSIEKGSIVTLIGRNGVGKTTTLKSVMGMVKSRTGTILFKGEDITHLNPHHISHSGIGIVPERRRLFSELTVRENLKLGYVGHDIESDFSEALEPVYENFPRLEERSEQHAGSLSGGEQQMLAIGRSLIAEPELLLIDEPTEGLMPSLVDELGEMLTKINNKGVTVLLVEQNVDLALEISDYTYVIDEGEIKYEGASKDIVNNKEMIDQYLLF